MPTDRARYNGAVALTLPTLAVGDVLRSYINTVVSKIQAYLNAIPGTALVAASVPSSALANAASWFAESYCYTGDMGGRSTADIIWKFTVPNIAGQVNSTFRLHGACFSARSVTLTNGALLEIKKNGVTKLTLDIGNLPLTSAVPLVTMIATPEASTSADVWTVVYTDAAAAVYTDACLKLFWSVTHITQPT